MNYKACRNLVKAKLIGHTDAGSRVYSGRLDAFQEDELPAIDIFTPNDLPGEGTTTSTLEIWLFVKSGPGEDVNDNADTLQEQVKAALHRFWEDSGEFTATYAGRDFQYNIESNWPYAISKRVYQLESLTDE